MKENRNGNGGRSIRARALNGVLILFFVFLLGSFLYGYLFKPILSAWEPAFVYFFGDVNGKWAGFIPKFIGFLLFSFGATVVFGIIVDAIVNSRRFSAMSQPLYKVSFVKRALSFFRSGADAYRNLRQARPILLKIGDIEVPAFITKERIFRVGSKRFSYLVVYCPHTPTFFTGNTFYIRKEKLAAEGIVNVLQENLIEDVLSAGIFGAHERLPEQDTTTE